MASSSVLAPGMYDNEIEEVVVIDNGGDSCKVGFAGQSKPKKLISNCGVRPKGEKKLFVADQIDEIYDFSSLHYRRPIERGYVTNWDFEKQVWQRIFNKKVLNVKPERSALIVTEPPFTPSSIQREMDEIVFEHFGFQRYLRTPTAPLILQAHQHGRGGFAYGRTCSVVIDCGYSFTHVTPLFNNTPINYGIRRVNVGGKLMTNYMKELISFRAWNMMDETHLIDDIKRKLCYVSVDFDDDLRKILSEKKMEKYAKKKRKTDVDDTKGNNSEQSKASNDPASTPASSSTGGGESSPGGTVAAAGGRSGLRTKSRSSFGGGGGSNENTSNTNANSSSSGSTAERKREREREQEEEEIPERTITQEYVLPNGSTRFTGYVKEDTAVVDPDDQLLSLGSERFSVPELLFKPNDIGLEQAGLAEAVVDAVESCHPSLRGLMYSNVLIAGGSSLFANFTQRLTKELRPLVNTDYNVGVTLTEHPITSAWRGGSLLGSNASGVHNKRLSVSKQQYEEYGSNICHRTFYQ